MIEQTGKSVFNNLPEMAAQNIHHILLADDDVDDCLLFKEGLDELQVLSKFTTIQNGEQLLQFLKSDEPLPDILFLDINMPRKNGFDCLMEIKENPQLKNLPVVIISTSFNQNIIDTLYKNGAQHYIQKPNDFFALKKLLHKAIMLIEIKNFGPPSKDKFIIN